MRFGTFSVTSRDDAEFCIFCLELCALYFLLEFQNLGSEISDFRSSVPTTDDKQDVPA
jgi:hypothetical protein